MTKIKSFLCELLVVVAVLLTVLVAGLVDIKTQQTPREEQNVKSMSNLLQDKEEDIDKMSRNLVEENKEVEEAKKQMDSLKSSDKVTEWNNSVINYNTKLSKYNEHLKEYDNALEQYNKNRSELNLTNKKNINLFEWVKSIIGI